MDPESPADYRLRYVELDMLIEVMSSLGIVGEEPVEGDELVPMARFGEALGGQRHRRRQWWVRSGEVARAAEMMPRAWRTRILAMMHHALGGAFMTMRVGWTLLLLLAGCTATPQLARGDELLDTGVEDSAEACASSSGQDDDNCHAPACDDEGCGLYRCEDLASPPYALRVAPSQAATGATARIQRYWGGAVPLPGRTPVFIIPWYRREGLPSATSVRKAIAEWQRRPKERHHIFPRAFEPYFATLGIEIHKYTLLVAVEEHKRVHAGANGGPWNRDWRVWIAEHRDTASREDHFRQGGKMVERYGLVGMPMTYWQPLSLLTASGE